MRSKSLKRVLAQWLSVSDSFILVDAHIMTMNAVMVKGECEKVVSASLYNSTWNSYAFTPQQVLRKSAMERFRTGRRSFY